DRERRAVLADLPAQVGRLDPERRAAPNSRRAQRRVERHVDRMPRGKTMSRVLALAVRSERPCTAPRPGPLDAVALKPRGEHRVAGNVEPVDSGRTLRLGLELEA